jgi:hypothetical protein
MNRFYSRDHEILIDTHIRSMTSKRRVKTGAPL